jgi:hypothetical protein
MLAELLRPETRAATEHLLALAREYRRNLIKVFDATCARAPTTSDSAAATAACGRLADELGVALVDQVRRMVIHEDRVCPWCSGFGHTTEPA